MEVDRYRSNDVEVGLEGADAEPLEEVPAPLHHRTEEDIRAEMAVEIGDLRQALKQKEQQLAALEKEVGITLLTKISSKMEHTVDAMKKSNVYQKTSSTMQTAKEKIANSQATNAIRRTFSSAAEKTSSALRSLGSTNKDKPAVEKSAGSEQPKASFDPLNAFSEKWKQASSSMRNSLRRATAKDEVVPPPSDLAVGEKDLS